MSSEEFTAEQREQLSQRMWDLFHDPSITIEQFLHIIKETFPEISHYGSLCDATPEANGNIPEPNESLVLAIFEPEEIQAWKDHNEQLARRKIAEINKLLLRLIYLRSILQGHNVYLTFLSSEDFNKFRTFVTENISVPSKLFFLLISLILDDLGRTSVIRDLVNQATGQSHDHDHDHDRYWRLFLLNYHAYVDIQQQYTFQVVIPSFRYLSPEQQRDYKNQVMTNSFNIAAFVQGESVPYSLYELICSCRNYHLRIIVLIFAFMSFRYNENFEAELFTKRNYLYFTTAAEIILNAGVSIEEHDMKNYEKLKNLTLSVYNHYLIKRAELAGRLSDSILLYPERERIVLYRIIALSRANDPDTKKILFVWKYLSEDVKKKLIEYMNVTGFDNHEKAIYIYYAPAIIGNTIAKVKEVEEFALDQADDEENYSCDYWVIGLYHSLVQLAQIYESERKPSQEVKKSSTPLAQGPNPHGAGVFIFNASKIAANRKVIDPREFHQISLDLESAKSNRTSMDLEA